MPLPENFLSREAMKQVYGWTDKEDTALKSLWHRDVVLSHIAGILNKQFPDKVRTRNSVIGRAHRLGLGPRTTAQQNGKKGNKVKKMNQLAAQAVPEQAPAQPKSLKQVVKYVPKQYPRSAKAVSMMELTEKTCRWPIGEVEDKANFHFCGCEPKRGSVYCAEHYKLAYNTTSTPAPVNIGPRTGGSASGSAVVQSFDTEREKVEANG